MGDKEYNDHIVYITIVGGLGMRGRSWNGHSVEVDMSLPNNLTDEQLKQYIIDSMIIEWNKDV